MHEDRVVDRLDKALEKLFAVLQPRAALLDIFEQRVDCGPELAKRLLLAFESNPARGAFLTHDPQHLAREVVEGALLPPLPGEQGQETCGRDGRGH